MALVVGTDTYATLIECAAYLSSHYPSADAKLAVWTVLTDGDCEIYLRQAAEIIDAEPLQGFKALTTQTMEFPRTLFTDVNYLAYVNSALLNQEGWYIQPGVPDVVKYAQCELALELAQGTSSQAAQRAELQRQGVRSYSIGKLSETFSGVAGAIVSYKARQYLQPYIGGGFRVD